MIGHFIKHLQLLLDSAQHQAKQLSITIIQVCYGKRKQVLLINKIFNLLAHSYSIQYIMYYMTVKVYKIHKIHKFN